MFDHLKLHNRLSCGRKSSKTIQQLSSETSLLKDEPSVGKNIEQWHQNVSKLVRKASRLHRRSKTKPDHTFLARLSVKR
jgi:hypothetical protein